MVSITDWEYEAGGPAWDSATRKRNGAPPGTDGAPSIGWWGSSFSYVDNLESAAGVRQLLPQKSSFIANWTSRWLFGTVASMKP